MATGPEFSRPIALEKIGRHSRIDVQASRAECEALAVRLRLPGVQDLACSFDLHLAETLPAGSVIAARGHLRARVVQSCVISLADFEAVIEEAFSVRFVPCGAENEEFDLEAEDEISYAGGLLDLGEAAAEQLSLALDPFPREPGAVFAAADPASEHPFAALQKLGAKDPLN